MLQYWELFLILYWMANFVVLCLFIVGAIARLINNWDNLNPHIRMDGIYFLAIFPLSAFLFIVGVWGSSGIRESEFGSRWFAICIRTLCSALQSTFLHSDAIKWISLNAYCIIRFLKFWTISCWLSTVLIVPPGHELLYVNLFA